MQNIYKYIEKTKTNKLKNNFYLLKKNELELFENDKSLFKYFYGENNFSKLKEILQNKDDIDNFHDKPEVKYGRIKFSIKTIQEKIEKEKNIKNVIFLENELHRLRKKEKKLVKQKNKRLVLFSEEDEKKSKVDNALETIENSSSKLIKYLFKKNDPGDAQLLKITRYILKAITVGVGLFIGVKMAMATPIILIIPIAVMVIYGLYKLLTVGSVKAISAFQKVLTFRAITRFLPDSIFKKLEEYAKNPEAGPEKFKNDMQKAIKDMEAKAKNQIIDFAQKSFLKINSASPKLILTIKIALLSFKAFRIFLNPISFILQFFSGMLLRSCGTVADSLLKVFEKNKTKENVLKASVDALIGVDVIPADMLMPKEQETAETKNTNESYSYYNVLNEIDTVYYQHIKNNVIKKSVFLKENNIYQEGKIDQASNNFFNKFYKKDKMEVVIGTIQKNNIKYDIYPISGKIKIKENKKQIKEAGKVKQKLEEVGLKNLSQFVTEDGTITVDSDEKFNMFKDVIVLNKTLPSESTPSEKKPEDKTEEIENKPEEENKEEVKENLLDNEKVFITIKTDSTAENLNISKIIPSSTEDILGYLELTKKEKKENNYRFSAKLFVKQLFDFRKNKLTSLFFEEEQTESVYKDVTEKEATVSLRFENNKYIVNSGKFLGLFGEKGKKGNVVTDFYIYLNSGIKQLKQQYLDKYKLEIDKLKPDQKQQLTNEIDKELSNIVNLSFKENNKTVDYETLKERKRSSLEKTIDIKKIKDGNEENVSEIEKIEDEKDETKKEEITDKNKFLKENNIFYLKIKDNEKIDISKLDLLKDQPTDGDGFVKLTKKGDSNAFSAEIFLKKVVNYKKNDLLKTIFESEEETKNEYVNLTEKPADLEIKIENDSFEIARKGGFLGFNKKIEKIGSLNNKYKEYADTVNVQIEKDFFRQNRDLSKEETENVKNKILDISNIDFKQNIEDIKTKKTDEIKSEFNINASENAEKEADEKKLPFVSSRNAIALGLFTVISSAAIAWHSAVSTNPLGLAIGAFFEAKGEAATGVLKKIFETPAEQITELNQSIKDGTGGLFNKVMDKFGVNTEDITKGANINSDPANSEGAQESTSGGGGGENADSETGDETNNSETENDTKTENDETEDHKDDYEEKTQEVADVAEVERVLVPSAPLSNETQLKEDDLEKILSGKNLTKDVLKTKLESLVDKDFKESTFEEIKKVWVKTHPEAKINIESITEKDNPKLFNNLKSFSDKVCASVSNPKDPFYTKSDIDINKVESKDIKDALFKNLDKGWGEKQISLISKDSEQMIKIIKKPVVAAVTDPIKPTPEITTEPIKPPAPADVSKPVNTEVTPNVKPPEPSTNVVADAATELTEEKIKKTKDFISSIYNKNEVIKIIEDGKEVPIDQNIKKKWENALDIAVRDVRETTDTEERQKYLDVLNSTFNNILSSANLDKVDLTKYDNFKKLFVKEQLLSLNQSYQYDNKDEEFLINEYFKLENKLNRWRK